MHHLYTFLVAIHIFAAIIGVGSAVAFNRILKTARNMHELKSAHRINKGLRTFPNKEV